MATNKDLEAKEARETQKDLDTKKDPETGEPSIEYLVEGLTEEELARVSGGLAVKLPMKCSFYSCSGISKCMAYCPVMNCGGVTCGSHACDSFTMPD